MSQSLERKSISQSHYSSQIPRLSSQSNIKREIEEQKSRIKEQLVEKYNQRYSKHSPYDKIFIQQIINNFLDTNLKKQKNLSQLDNQIASILSDNSSKLALLNSLKSQNQLSDPKLVPNLKNQQSSTQNLHQQLSSTSLQFQNLLSDMDQKQIINNTLTQIDNQSLNIQLNSTSAHKEEKTDDARQTKITNYFSQTPQNPLDHQVMKSPNTKIEFYNPNKTQTLHQYHPQSTKILNNQNTSTDALFQSKNIDPSGGIIQKLGEQTFIGHLLSQNIKKNQNGENQLKHWFSQNWDEYSDVSSDTDDQNNQQNQIEVDHDHNWAELVKLDSELFKQQNQLQQQKLLQTKQMMAESLAVQIEQKNQQKQNEDKIQSQYVKIRDQMDQQHYDIEQQRENEQKLLNSKFKHELDDQYTQLSKQQKKQKKQQKKVDEYFQNKFIEQLKNEEEEIKDKRVKELHFYQQAISSHKNWYKLKLQEDQQSQIEDQLMIKSNCDNMEQIEKGKIDQQNENLEKITISMEQSQQTFESMAKLRQIQLQKELEKIQEKQRQAEQQQNQRELGQIQQRKDQMQKLSSQLSQQISKKNSQQEFQESINKKQAQIWKEDFQKYMKEMSEQEQNFRHARLYNSQALEQQMKDQKPSDSQYMTKEEFLQNKNQILFYQSMLQS